MSTEIGAWIRLVAKKCSESSGCVKLDTRFPNCTLKLGNIGLGQYLTEDHFRSHGLAGMYSYIHANGQS